MLSIRKYYFNDYFIILTLFEYLYLRNLAATTFVCKSDATDIVNIMQMYSTWNVPSVILSNDCVLSD